MQALPEQIAYDADRTVTATCTHLRAIEGALRGAGLRMHLRTLRHVELAGPLDVEHWRARFAIPDCVVAEEIPAFDRSHLDPPAARVRCLVCDSSIVGGSVAPGSGFTPR